MNFSQIKISWTNSLEKKQAQPMHQKLKKAEAIPFHGTCSSCTDLELYSPLSLLWDHWKGAGLVLWDLVLYQKDRSNHNFFPGSWNFPLLLTVLLIFCYLIQITFLPPRQRGKDKAIIMKYYVFNITSDLNNWIWVIKTKYRSELEPV